MGSRAPTTTTTIKNPDPVIVREWASPEYLTKLGDIAGYYGQRALQERSTYQDMVNRTMESYGRTPTYSPMVTTAGRTIQPGQVEEPYDLSGLVQAAKTSGMFKTSEEKEENKNEDSREVYNEAIKRSEPRYISNKFNSPTYYDRTGDN
jgi:hypothetical protein